MAAKIFRINYKSDFILTLNSDAGWMTPFCIKFWTGAPSQAYYVQWDGTTYTHCAYDPSEPTKLMVQFDDHHLPIGDLKFQIAYHFTVADFPNDTEDEVINPANITTEIDGETYQVMLDFTGETAPEIEFSLPAYANEAQRIANEQQRIANEQTRIENEQTRISNEQTRVAHEQTRQQNEAQRIAQESARVSEFASLKSASESATRDANNAATLANEKAQLADDKAALADGAATQASLNAVYAHDEGQLAGQKAIEAAQATQLATNEAAFAHDQGNYAKQQGDYAKEQGDTALADHVRANEDHSTAAADHTTAGNDHTRAESDHSTAAADHTTAGNDNTRAESDHGIAVEDHTQAGNDHTRADSDHGIAADDHTQAGNDHTRAESDHTRAESDHAAVEVYVDSLGAFDISAYHATGGVLAEYADLTAALGTNGANIPDALRKGGMSIKFIQGTVQNSDHKYVQYRYMGTATTGSPNPFLDTANWQGVVDMPIAGSQNLVKSGGAYFTFFNYIVNSLGNKSQIAITATSPIIAFPVNKGKKYYIYVKASEAGETNDVGIYENKNSTNTIYLHLTKAQFEGGFVFEYSTNQDNMNIAFRTKVASTVEYTVLEDYRIIDVLDEINNQILDSGSIVAASTSVLDWSYNLKANETVVLYAQCNNALNANAGWYINSSKIHTFENIQNGDYYVYTPNTDVVLTTRTGVSGVTLNWKVLSYRIGQALVKLENLIKQTDDNIQVQILDKGTIISDSTGLLDWNYNLKANHRYTLYAQSNGTLESANRGFYNWTKGTKIINLPSDISDGYYAEYTPSEDITIGLRTGTIGDVVNYAVYSDDLHEVINSLYDKTVKVDEFEDRKIENYWYGKIIAGYGDSITNHAGSEWSAPWTHFPKTGDYQYSWAYYVGMAYQLAKYYGRGIGGQCFAWNGRAGLNGGSVTFINAKGEADSRNDSYDYDNYTGSIPSGCVKSRGALCSWKRITDMFPASIKDTIHAVLVMGGTNDVEWSTDFEFVPNDTTDPEWAASSYYNTIGGDYNINSLAGGFASTIMKLQLWMPNAVIIVMTPSPNNAGGSPRFEENLDLISTAYNKSLKIKSVADIMSLALIDINAHSGINSLTGYTYIGDGVHPTNRGKMMIARVIIGELKNIIPMTIEET